MPSLSSKLGLHCQTQSERSREGRECPAQAAGLACAYGADEADHAQHKQQGRPLLLDAGSAQLKERSMPCPCSRLAAKGGQCCQVGQTAT